MSNNGVRARSAFNDSIMLRIRRADFEARLTMSANRESASRINAFAIPS
jgi:hypothetical protein